MCSVLHPGGRNMHAKLLSKNARNLRYWQAWTYICAIATICRSIRRHPCRSILCQKISALHSAPAACYEPIWNEGCSPGPWGHKTCTSPPWPVRRARSHACIRRVETSQTEWLKIWRFVALTICPFDYLSLQSEEGSLPSNWFFARGKNRFSLTAGQPACTKIYVKIGFFMWIEQPFMQIRFWHVYV